MLKFLFYGGAMLVLTACSPTYHAPPRLDDGAAVAWIYQCEQGRIKVEYAEMGGQYTATLDIARDGEVVQRKVLLREADGSFVLDDWRWRSDAAGKIFRLTERDVAHLTGCHNRNIHTDEEDKESGTVRLQLGRIFRS